jgi:MFS family permease
MSLQRNIRLLTWFNFFTEFKLYSPIAIIYFSAVTHSYALGASIFSIDYVTSAIFDVPTGILADRIGRKRIVVLGAASSVVYATFYAIGINFWFLAVGAAFSGLSRALYSGNNNALLHNMLSDEGMEGEYHTYLGRLSSMFEVAQAVSGLLGAVIANWSFAAIMWLSVIPQVLCLLLSLQIRYDRRADGEAGGVGDPAVREPPLLADLKEGVRNFVGNMRLRLLGTASILEYGIGETSWQFQGAFYNTLLPIWAVGVAKTLANVVAALGFHFSGRIIDRYGSTRVLLAGGAFGKIMSLIALVFPTTLSPFIMSSGSFFFGTGTVAANSLMQREFTDRQRATMSSLNSFAGSLFFGLFAFGTGLYADAVGTRDALLLIQIPSLLTLWLLWRLYRVVASG